MDNDSIYRRNKWGVRVIKRGSDYDSAEILNHKDFPDEIVIAKAMWPNDAMQCVNEHNDCLARILFIQE